MLLTRRQLLRSSGLVVAAATGPALWRQPAMAGTRPPEQVHLQFGRDAAREMVVSWVTVGSVRRPRVRLGTPAGGYGTTVPAQTKAFVDGETGVEVVTHHAELTGLLPSHRYLYEVRHDGGVSVTGAFRTAPVGREPLRFTSFGDQGTGENNGPAGTSTIWGAYVVGQIEQLDPLFHLLNGDLAYANLAADRSGAWDQFFGNNSRSARFRPWMPALGNHENELGNGDTGFDAYRTRFFLPDNGDRDFAGHWYAFTAGSVRVISVDADDVVYQDGGDFYVRGYSSGRQRRWLERELKASRANPAVDWIVVVQHQLAMSSSAVNGPDLGVREELVPLYDRYGVDLVLCGHDHHYERTHPVRGVDATSPTLTPTPVADGTATVDSEKGTVYLCIGGGGSLDLTPLTTLGRTGHPVASVITGRAPSDRMPEAATWSAVRDHDHPYGFLAVDVDPGDRPGGVTTLTLTQYLTAPSVSGTPTPADRCVLRRRRSDRAASKA